MQARLGNAEMDLAEVSAHFGITFRYVNSLFQQEETSFGRYVLVSRLRACPRPAPSYYTEPFPDWLQGEWPFDVDL